MSHHSRTYSSRPHRRYDEPAWVSELLSNIRTMSETIGRLEDEVKDHKQLLHQLQDSQTATLSICKEWEGHDGQYAAQEEVPHADEGSQYTDDSNPQGGEASSDTAYDASRDVSNAPADEQPPARVLVTPDQDMRAFEDDDHKSVKALHDDELEPSTKRQRVDGANDGQSGTQVHNWVPRYPSQQVRSMIYVSCAHI